MRTELRDRGWAWSLKHGLDLKVAESATAVPVTPLPESDPLVVRPVVLAEASTTAAT